jgi:hypothetical protein
MLYEKKSLSMAKWDKPFLILIYHSPLVKAAMNAACVCCAMVVTKHLYSFFFQWPKAEQRPKRICQLQRDKVFAA